MKGEKQKLRVDLEWIRDQLVATAVQRGHLAAGTVVSAVPIERHKRHHVVSVGPSHKAKATPGHCGLCAYAWGAGDLPGVMAAMIFRRVSYTLELTEKGKPALFKFGTPDVARTRTVEFDMGKGMIDHSMAFHPLSKTRLSGAARAYVKASRIRRKGKTVARGPLTQWQTMRVSIPADLQA